MNLRLLPPPPVPAAPTETEPAQPPVTTPNQHIKPHLQADKKVKAQQPRTDYLAMADERYNKFPFDGGIRGDARVDSATFYFKNGKYADAIRLLSDTSAALPIDGQELLGRAYYQNRQFSAAAATFEVVAEQRLRPFSDRSEWAQCLSLLAQMPATKPELEAVLKKNAADSDHAYSAKATELEKELRK